jgi:hypothetical protein
MRNTAPMPISFYIGWDVGGWNCDTNRNSRDAIVILDDKRSIIGTPWRGNLRLTINKSDTTRSWLEALFAHCQADLPDTDSMQVVLAIDTPLGFSEAFTRLLARDGFDNNIGQSDTNPYLFRQTERFLFDHGLKPLSPVKDMIGSQATKGMHVLAKFTPMMAQCGVWKNDATLIVIEAYPSACKQSPFFQKLLGRYVIGERTDPPGRLWVEQIDHQDKLDALTCALIAHTFKFHRDALAHPPDLIPLTEGWIWVPYDALQHDVRRQILID